VAHDVFISYSHEDKPVADTVCVVLESEKIRCWIAPRDIPPGKNYPGEIMNAVKNCQVFVLVYSSHSNTSQHVLSETEKAMNCRIPIIPLRITDVPLTPDMEYYIGRYQWLDALTAPLEKHLPKLTQAVQALLHINPPDLTGENIIQELHNTFRETNHQENQIGISAVSESPSPPPESDFISFEQNKLRLIPGGEFLMGEEGNQRKVKVEPFFMGICPVTNQEYERFDPEHKKRRNEFSNADDEPVIWVSWDDANAYCRWLSEKTGRKYRLPDEAEWEYACRAGSAGLYSIDINGIEVNETNLKDYAVYNTQKTMPVKQRKPNFFGLYDMHGNVWEWCQDYYDDSKKYRVLRGGSWNLRAGNLRSSYRGFSHPDIMSDFIGFRVVSVARTQS
jgi:hypothetical protein